MKVFRNTWQLFCRKGRETLRNPVFIMMGLASPILYLTLFAPLLKNFAGSMGFPTDNILNVFVPGMLVMGAYTAGLFSGFGVIDELRSGVIERFRVTPCSRFAILGGLVATDLVAMLGVSVFFTLIALPFGFKPSFFGLLLLYILLSLLTIICSAFGNAMGLITKNEDKFAPIVHGVNLPIMLLSGMLLPLALAPNWLQILAHFNPVYYIVEAARFLVAGDLTAPIVIQAFLITSALAAFVLFWGTRVFRKAVA